MKKLLSSTKFQVGFTLIELLIVIVIIVIVVGVGAASYTTVARNGRNTERASDLQKLAIALEEYYADHGIYPNTDSKFESAGRSVDDLIRCVVGGSTAMNVFTGDGTPGSFWDCRDIMPVVDRFNPDAYNTYIANGDPLNLPVDPLYESDWHSPAGHYGYATDSTGQSFALVTRHYEGQAPQANRFTASSDPYFWDKALNNSPWPAELTDGDQYIVRSPVSPP